MAIFYTQLCERYGWYIVENRATIRQTAEKFGASKSTVHKYVTKLLPTVNPLLAREVRKVLDENKEESAIRGGAALKRKYELARLRAEMDKTQEVERAIVETSLRLKKSDSK